MSNWIGGEPLGYMVAEINQASHQPERTISDSIDWDRATAELAAETEREATAAIGRRETYIVCALVPVETEDQP